MPYDGPGVYRHYKGNLYWVIGKGVKEDTLSDAEPLVCVVYMPLSASPILEDREEKFWLRELSDFNAMVERSTHFSPLTGHTDTVPRFVKVKG